MIENDLKQKTRLDKLIAEQANKNLGLLSQFESEFIEEHEFKVASEMKSILESQKVERDKKSRVLD